MNPGDIIPKSMPRTTTAQRFSQNEGTPLLQGISMPRVYRLEFSQTIQQSEITMPVLQSGIQVQRLERVSSGASLEFGQGGISRQPQLHASAVPAWAGLGAAHPARALEAPVAENGHASATNKQQPFRAETRRRNQSAP